MYLMFVQALSKVYSMSVRSEFVCAVYVCMCVYVCLCMLYICISLLFIPNVYSAQGNPGEPGIRGPTVRISILTHLCTYSIVIIKILFLTFVLVFQGPMGGNGSPGAPGVKVNAALFDIDPRISFISIDFRSTIIE